MSIRDTLRRTVGKRLDRALEPHEISSKLRRNAAPLLQPGETIQSVFPAQTVSPFLVFSNWIAALSNGRRAVVVTDQRIMVCRSGRFRASLVKGIETELPRSTRIGDPSGWWGWRCDTLGRRLYIFPRFYWHVRQADAALAGM